MRACKGSDWIRLVFAHPFPLNSRAPIASANFIAHGKVQVSTYGVASSYTLMMEPVQLIGAKLFKTNGWAQSSPYPVSTFGRVRRLFWDYRPHMLRKCLIQIWSFPLEASGQKPYSSTQTSWFYCNHCGEKAKKKKDP